MERLEVLSKSKELVEQIYENMRTIETCDSVAESIKDLELCFSGLDNKPIVSMDGVLSIEQLKELREMIIDKIYSNASAAQSFLERLYRKLAIINPDFEAAIQGMVQSKDKPIIIDPSMDEPELPPVTKTQQTLHGKNILSKGAEQDSTVFDMDPESKPIARTLTDYDVEGVRRMYQTEGKSMKEIAEHYGVTKSVVNNFIYNKRLTRNKIKDDGFLDAKVQAKQKQSAETEYL